MGWGRITIGKMEFVDIVRHIHPLKKEDLQNLLSLSETVQVSKNTVFIEADKPSKYIYFLQEGICRIYYHKADIEIILAFSFPGEAMISLNNYVYGTRGYENIEALETSIMTRIEIASLQDLYENSTAIANWGRKLAEFEILKIEERLMQKLFKTASERYQDLIRKESNITNRVKLGFIASYLGVTQVTLSRIRANTR
ncbi:Crp/Fnr family transcriptional regulator [Sphingobacterium olei]|uniref:Crp/Fnr family transcriptional regulator n=2 Tax=Sphingobacterium olei TaxID=2571155 RepID=A0A4U0NEL1_9SPHI|nr:Crp/Fnr family transcriptional regulator [Sphingobacterium olei]